MNMNIQNSTVQINDLIKEYEETIGSLMSENIKLRALLKQQQRMMEANANAAAAPIGDFPPPAPMASDEDLENI